MSTVDWIGMGDFVNSCKEEFCSPGAHLWKEIPRYLIQTLTLAFKNGPRSSMWTPPVTGREIANYEGSPVLGAIRNSPSEKQTSSEV